MTKSKTSVGSAGTTFLFGPRSAESVCAVLPWEWCYFLEVWSFLTYELFKVLFTYWFLLKLCSILIYFAKCFQPVLLVFWNSFYLYAALGSSNMHFMCGSLCSDSCILSQVLGSRGRFNLFPYQEDSPWHWSFSYNSPTMHMPLTLPTLRYKTLLHTFICCTQISELSPQCDIFDLIIKNVIL